MQSDGIEGEAGAQPGECCFERVAGERLGVLARREPVAQVITAAPIDRGAQDAEHDVRVDVLRQLPGVDRLLDQAGQLGLHRADEREALPDLADPRHRAVHEHQREVLGCFRLNW